MSVKKTVNSMQAEQLQRLLDMMDRLPQVIFGGTIDSTAKAIPQVADWSAVLILGSNWATVLQSSTINGAGDNAVSVGHIRTGSTSDAYNAGSHMTYRYHFFWNGTNKTLRVTGRSTLLHNASGNHNALTTSNSESITVTILGLVPKGA